MSLVMAASRGCFLPRVACSASLPGCSPSLPWHPALDGWRRPFGEELLHLLRVILPALAKFQQVLGMQYRAPAVQHIKMRDAFHFGIVRQNLLILLVGAVIDRHSDKVLVPKFQKLRALLE